MTGEQVRATGSQAAEQNRSYRPHRIPEPGAAAEAQAENPPPSGLNRAISS